MAPVRAGDVLEVEAELVEVGNTSRKMLFTAHKVIELSRDPKLALSAAEVLPEPVLVCRAIGTCVVPKECQRRHRGGAP